MILLCYDHLLKKKCLKFLSKCAIIDLIKNITKISVQF